MPTSEVELLEEHWIPMKPLTYEQQEVVSITRQLAETLVYEKHAAVSEVAAMMYRLKSQKDLTYVLLLPMGPMILQAGN